MYNCVLACLRVYLNVLGLLAQNTCYCTAVVANYEEKGSLYFSKFNVDTVHRTTENRNTQFSCINLAEY